MGRSASLVCAAVVLLAGIVYLNALDNPLVYDDHLVITENRSLQEPFNLAGLVLHDIARPVTNVSFAIDRVLWGPEPFGFHLTNLLLHMMNVGLLFLLAWQVTRDRHIRNTLQAPINPLVVSSCAALVFAVHPMLSEAVGYISGRSEVLCATWLLLALISARRWMLTNGHGWLLLAGGLWAAALLTKETAAMFPVAVLLYDRLLCPGIKAERRRRVIRLHLPLFGVAAAAVVVRLAIFMFIEHTDPITAHWQFLLVELDVFRQYVALLLIPRGQSIFHAVSPVSGILDPRVVAASGIVALSGCIAWRLRRVEGLVGFGLLWFLIMLVPSSALVVLDRGELMAEHRVYVASIGFFLVLGVAGGWIWSGLTSARNRRIVQSAGAVWLVLLAGQTVVRNSIWADETVVWSEALQYAPDHWLPHLLLGEALQRDGRCGEAVSHFRTSIDRYPEESASYRKLGACLFELQRFNEAEVVFTELLAQEPGSIEGSNGLGALALSRRKPSVARRYFEQSLEHDPENAAASRGLAIIDEQFAQDPDSQQRP